MSETSSRPPIDLDALERQVGAPDKRKLTSEALAFMGARFSVNDNPVPLPTAGSVCLLEVLGNRFIVGGQPDEDDARVAFFLFSVGEAAAGLTQHMLIVNDEGEAIKLAAKHFCEAKGIDNEAALGLLRSVILQVVTDAIIGFNFFPRSNGDDGKPALVFGAEWLASMTHLGAQCGLKYREVLWEIPLATLGFLGVARAQFDGNKTVTRLNTFDWSRAMKQADPGERDDGDSR